MATRRQPGDVTRQCLDVLRDAGRPLTTTDIIDRMVDMPQFDFGNKSHVRDVWGVVATRLRSLEAQGLLAAGGTGQHRTWDLAYPARVDSERLL